MPEGMNEFLWFILGVLSYRIIAGILQYGHLAILFEQQLNDILKLLHILSEELDKAFEMKYSIMKDAGTHDEEIKIVQDVDDKLLKIWKEMIIARIITHWPKAYKRIVKFNNWREAIEQLRKAKKKLL